MRTITLNTTIVVDDWTRELEIVATYDVEADGFVYVQGVEASVNLSKVVERLAANAIKERILIDDGDKVLPYKKD